jgi:hypothetical protein
MSSFTIVGGCVLINDILKTNKYTGGKINKENNKEKIGNEYNNRFKDLGIPIGYFSTIQNNSIKNNNSIHNINNEKQPYIDTILFNHFLKSVI